MSWRLQRDRDLPGRLWLLPVSSRYQAGQLACVCVSARQDLCKQGVQVSKLHRSGNLALDKVPHSVKVRCDLSCESLLLSGRLCHPSNKSDSKDYSGSLAGWTGAECKQKQLRPCTNRYRQNASIKDPTRSTQLSDAGWMASRCGGGLSSVQPFHLHLAIDVAALAFIS